MYFHLRVAALTQLPRAVIDGSEELQVSKTFHHPPTPSPRQGGIMTRRGTTKFTERDYIQPNLSYLKCSSYAPLFARGTLKSLQ